MSNLAVNRLFMDVFETLGVRVIRPVPPSEKREVDQCWRNVYAPGTGRAFEPKKRRPRLGWYTFVDGVAPCLQGRSALDEYFRQRVGEYWVIAEELDLADGYLCESKDPPDLRQPELDGLDVFVSATDFSWTMVFTHEWRQRVGPFFSCVEWLEWFDGPVGDHY